MPRTMQECHAGRPRPNLSHLPEPLRLRIAVAECLGAVWRHVATNGAWVLSTARLSPPLFMLFPGQQANYLPDYEHNPAAWGALLEAELGGVNRSTTYKHLWFGSFENGVGRFEAGAYAPAPGRAVCLAVLAKRGIQWPPEGT